MKFFSQPKRTIFSVCLLSFIFFSTLVPANLIFDMDGVLVKQSRFSACINIGLSKFIGLYNPLTLDQKLFDFLDILEPHTPDSPKVINNGRRLPQIMVDWLAGTKTTKEIREIIELGLEKHDSYFTTNSQKALIAAMAEFIFTPDKFIRAMYPVSDAIKLVKKCSKTTDKQGKRNRIFILSNWDAESFDLLNHTKALRHMFRRTDGIIISGAVHMVKPQPDIFAHLLTTYNINPKEELTIFVDDTLANLEPAKEFGIHTIHCKNVNIKAVKKEFKSLGVI